MERSILKLEASAGSGKTYRLALEYLSRLLLAFSGPREKAPDPRQQREILGSVLAITFTVKAAQEMKRRILKQLKAFALSQGEAGLGEADREFLGLLARETKLPPGRIIELSRQLIELVLASYDDFNVTTIDSLMSAMVKAVSPDLDLPADYEIAVDARDALAETGRALLADLANSQWERLAATLGDFKKFDPYCGWKTDEALAEKLVALFHLDLREGIRLEGETRQGRESRFLTHRNAFRVALAVLLETLARESGHANNRVVNGKLLESVAAFPWEEANPLQLEKLLTKSFFSKPRAEELLKKNGVPAEFAAAVDSAFGRMRAHLQELALDLSILKTFPYREFFFDFSRRWQANKDTLFVEEFSRTLAGRFAEWGKTGIPYLYLKMSDRFLHFLFDEFQDTSTLQFKALAPLIDEMLSRRERGSLFIVGDRKQAIYRWRGGNAGLMDEAALVTEIPAIHNLAANGFSHTLNKNWRSRREIVQFNNEFWEAGAISRIAAEADLQQGIAANFADSRQDLPEDGHKDGGYVELSLDTEEGENAGEGAETGTAISGRQLAAISTILSRLRKHGFPYAGIAVLVRKNIQVRDIVRHLGREGVPTISDQSLLLDSNPRVNEIIAFFKFLDYPPDDLNFHAFISSGVFLATASSTCPREFARFSQDDFIDCSGPLYKAFQKKYPSCWAGLIEPFFQSVGFLPPYDLFSDFCQVFRIYETFPGDTPFFLTLGDTLHGAELLKGSSISGFLRRWDKMVEKSNSPVVAIPEHSPGVRVLTMHQSKGLEFAAVIVPLNESGDMNQSALHWEQGKPFHITNAIALMQDGLKEVLCRENIKGTIDLLNLLYVAFTRAREALFVPISVAARPETPAKEKSGLVKRIGKASDIVCSHPLLAAWLDDLHQRPFIRGRLQPVRETLRKDRIPEAVPAKMTMTRSWQAAYLVFKKAVPEVRAERSGVGRGERVHDLLSRLEAVTSPGQLTARVQELAAAAGWNAEEASSLLAYLCRDDVFSILRRGREVHAEKEVVDHSGARMEFRRLDRLQVGPNEVLVIDFKTGQQQDAGHISQLREYLAAVSPFFPGKKCSGYLLYIDRGEVAEVPCSS